MLAALGFLDSWPRSLAAALDGDQLVTTQGVAGFNIVRPSWWRVRMKTKRVRRTGWLGIGVSVVAVSLAGCTSSSAPTERGDVIAVSQNAHVQLTNHTARPVFATVFGRTAVALINWAPCVDASRCAPITPGDTQELMYPVPLLGEGEHEAVVYWWHAVRGSDGALRPDSVRAFIVHL